MNLAIRERLNNLKLGYSKAASATSIDRRKVWRWCNEGAPVADDDFVKFGLEINIFSEEFKKLIERSQKNVSSHGEDC